MVPVQIIESHSAVPLGLTDGSIEVAVGTGVVLRFQVGANVAYMADLIVGVGRRVGC